MNDLLNRVHILNVFLGRVGIVEAQMTDASVFHSDTKIEADRLGVPNMQIAIRFWWEASHNAAAVFVRLQITSDDLTNKVRWQGPICGAPAVSSRCNVCRNIFHSVLSSLLCGDYDRIPQSDKKRPFTVCQSAVPGLPFLSP